MEKCNKNTFVVFVLKKSLISSEGKKLSVVSVFDALNLINKELLVVFGKEKLCHLAEEIQRL